MSQDERHPDATPDLRPYYTIQAENTRLREALEKRITQLEAALKLLITNLDDTQQDVEQPKGSNQ